MYTDRNVACNVGVFWRAHLDQSSAILDLNSEEAWGETKMRPREWEFIFPHPLPTHFYQTNMAANLRSRASKRLHCRLTEMEINTSDENVLPKAPHKGTLKGILAEKQLKFQSIPNGSL